MIRRTIHTNWAPSVGPLAEFAPDIVGAVEHDGGTTIERPQILALLCNEIGGPDQDAHVYPLSPQSHFELTAALAKSLPDERRVDLISTLTGGIHLPGGAMH